MFWSVFTTVKMWPDESKGCCTALDEDEYLGGQKIATKYTKRH